MQHSTHRKSFNVSYYVSSLLRHTARQAYKQRDMGAQPTTRSKALTFQQQDLPKEMKVRHLMRAVERSTRCVHSPLLAAQAAVMFCLVPTRRQSYPIVCSEPSASSRTLSHGQRCRSWLLLLLVSSTTAGWVDSMISQIFYSPPGLLGNDGTS